MPYIRRHLSGSLACVRSRSIDSSRARARSPPPLQNALAAVRATVSGGDSRRQTDRQTDRQRASVVVSDPAAVGGGLMDGMQQQGFGAYGAGRAGGAFDPLTFIQQPHTGLRIVSWLFSLVIFGCVANEGYINRPDEVQQFCIFNRNQNACNYAVGVGSLAFLCCLLFLALDVYFPQISSVKDRKKAVLADVGTSAFWSFMWFVGFCLLANQWQVAKPEDNPLGEGGDAARAAIAFSFFSIFTWGALALFSLQRLKRVQFEEEYEELFTDQPPDLTRTQTCFPESL